MEQILTEVGVLIQELEPMKREAEARAEALSDLRLKQYNQGKADQLAVILGRLRRLYAAIQLRIENTKPR